MKTEPLEVVSLSKKEFDNQRAKPDNVLFFVYEEYVSEDKKAKVRIRLYKGKHLVLGDLYEVVANLKGCDCSFKIGEVGFLPAGSKPKVTNTGTEQQVVLNVKIPADKILEVGDVSLTNCGEPKVTITQDPNNPNRQFLNVTFQKSNQIEAGTARLLTADAKPTITVNDSPNNPDVVTPASENSGISTQAIVTAGNTKYVHIGVPSSPYIKTTEDTPSITGNNTGLGSLGYAQKTDYLNDGWLDDIKIVGKKQIVKNNRDYPCFVFARTFPSNGDTENYSSTDNILLIPPQGKGIITHDKTYPGNGVGVSQVYPAMKTKPKVIYEVLFKSAEETTVYDSINEIKTQISGSNLSYSSASGLSGDNLTITLPPTEPAEKQRPGASYKYMEVNKLDSILYPYAFFCMIHFIGSSAANVDTVMQCCGSIDVQYKNLTEKILVLSPFLKYSTNNLDLLKWSELSLFSTGLQHWIYHAVSKFTFTVKSGSIKGIRIIAGTPADFLRDPEFLLYKFD